MRKSCERGLREMETRSEEKWRMHCTSIIIGFVDGLGSAWHGMASWKEKGLNMPDTLSDVTYFGSHQLYSI